MKHAICIGALIIMSAVSAGAQSLKTNEVRGVSTGMTLAQVQTALVQSYPGHSSVMPMRAGNKFLPYFLIDSKQKGNGPRETVTVEFGQGTGKAISIEREVFSQNPGIEIESLKAGLEQKYGPSVDNESDVIYGRATDEKGAPDRSCYGKYWAPVATIRPSNRPDCTQSLRVTVGPRTAPGVTKQYKLVLIDHRVALDEIRIARVQSDASQLQSQKRLQDAARGVKPQL